MRESGMTMQDYVNDMSKKDVGRFPLDMFWFLLDGNNQVAALFGYHESSSEFGPNRLWGFGLPRVDVDGIPYLALSMCYRNISE